MKGNFTLFLSGVEPRENFEVVSGVTPHILLSYYYIRRRGIAEIKERLQKHNGMKILIDSGAFTFFKDPQYTKKTIEWWEKYIQNYVTFVRTYREYIFACVELDIDTLVGAEKVNEWREKYFYPLEEEGINVIYLYHTDKDLDFFDLLCKKHPYVGFSYVELKRELEEQSDVDAMVANLFNIAQKHHTAIHGFAITGNRMLQNYPFFSADSTSYLTGSQFGTITYFEEGKLKHLDKDTWKTQYMEKLRALGLSKKLLNIESPYELIKANAIGYSKFEKHIQQIMLPRKYWEGRMNTEYKLPQDSWFDTEMLDWKEKLQEAGIDDRIPENVGITLLRDMYVILNNTKEVSSYNLEDLVELCSIFNATGTNYNTKDKCLKFLKEAFKEHLEGARDDLNDLDRSDSQNLKDTFMERENYIQEQEYVDVELSKEECGKLLPALLTAGYDKESVEKELIEQGITPVYDKNGDILKGIKSLRKQKKISTRMMPRWSCDRCVIAMNCPEYEAGKMCAYDKQFRKFNTRNVEDVMDGMTAIANVAIERAMKAFMQETAMGGTPTKTTSNALKDAWDYLERLRAITNEVNGSPLTVSKTKVGNGMVEHTVVSGSNPQDGGLLAKIFLSDDKDEIETIDADIVKEK